MPTKLAEGHRMQLDGIIQRMITNEEPEENIRWVVSDFKQKYGKPTEPERPSAFGAVVEPFKRAAAGLVQLPGAVAAGVRAAPEVDWRDLLRHPGPLAETLAPMALPIAGAAIGSTVGPAGTAAGLVGGEFANEAIRQLWTGQPQAPLETLTRGATAGVLPAAAPKLQSAITGAIRRMPRVLPGGSTALQEEGASIARGLPTKIQAEASSPLYQAYKQAGPASIPTPTLTQELGKLGTKEAMITKALQEPMIRNTVKDLTRMTGGGAVDLESLRLNLSRAGKTARALEETNPEVAGALKNIFKAGWNDIEAASAGTGPQAQLLKLANRAYRREMAQESLMDWIEGTPTKRGAIMQREDGLTQFNAGKVLDRIRRDDFWRASLEPSELKAITSTLEELGKTPKLPSVRGQQFGTGAVIGRTVAGGGLGAYAGGPLGGAAGGYLAANAPRWISSALMTQRGRSLLMRMLKAKDTLSPQEVSLLGATVGATVQSQLPGQPQ